MMHHLQKVHLTEDYFIVGWDEYEKKTYLTEKTFK